MIWACPLCHSVLTLDENGAFCDTGHRFDRAKQGYLHLLPAHQKRSSAPGDDRQMLLQRREFLQAGFYSPLANLLQEQWLKLLSRRAGHLSSAMTLLDCGCGEGYYLHQLQTVSKSGSGDVCFYGIDISKEAAKLSARELPEAEIAVASGFQLPVQSGSVGLLLRVFAPGDSAEVARVLQPDGEFWRVVPGPEHLLELKQSLYQKVKRHELPAAPEGFELAEQIELRFTMALDSNRAVQQLLQMTPFVWRGSVEGKKSLQALDSLEVTAEFMLQKYRLVKPDQLVKQDLKATTAVGLS